MEKVSQIIPAGNSSNINGSQTVQTQESLVHSEAVAIRTNWEEKAHINKYVSSSSEKTTDNKAARLKRQREHKRELRKDPAYVMRERERQRKRYKERCQTDPAYSWRIRDRQRERYRNDLAYAERHRQRQKERQRELRKDPAYIKRERERQRKLRKDPAYVRHRRNRKKQHCQSVNSAETTQSSSKNSEGTAPRFSVVKLKEYLQPRSAPLSLSERSAIEGAEGTGHCSMDRQTA